jgi:2'-5' RNA ligase
MPPHVTLLYPFIPVRAINPSVNDAISEIVGHHATFPFRLTRVGAFPGVTYLSIEPEAPFLDLITALLERWPQHPPYAGRYAAVLPHVTVAVGEVAPGRVRELESALPIESAATEVRLMVEAGAGGWSALRSFPLGA